MVFVCAYKTHMSLCHYAIMPLAAIMPLCTAYNIQHTTSHHAYDIYTSTTSSMQVCNNNLKCQHFSPNCADVLNVGSVPTPGPSCYLATMFDIIIS